MSKLYIKKNSNFSEVNGFFIKISGAWSSVTQEYFLTHYSQYVTIFGGEVASVRFEIQAPSTVEAISCQCSALYDFTPLPSGVVWAIVSGATYGTIDSNGLITIDPNANQGEIVVTATYRNRVATHTILVTYKSGTSSETTTDVVIDENGNATTIVTTVTENEDGSSYVEERTVITDESGNTIGSSESTTTNNADGSMTSQTTNYDANGDPTDGTNVSGDTSGNVSTQSIEYDESGNTTVTGYEIDTSDNPNGSKSMNGDGVNTEYYAFDVTRGFIVDIAFTVDMSNKPAGQNENHHNILTAKRASPSPWYGFQLRQSTTNQYIQLGTQFSTGSNTNTRIDPISKTGNTGEYDLKIIYDPTLSTDSFVVINKANDTVVYRSNGKFPDIEDLKYIKVTLGYAMDENGDPFRYSKIDVKNFSIRRITYVEDPVISCDGENVSISCETAGATIYYRLNEVGVFIPYNAPIAISANTVVEAYSVLDEQQSNTVKQTCIYDNGMIAPVIDCDGENVEITCEMQGASIYYRIGESGEYSLYESAFTISANTIVQAYSELNSKRSAIITENCIYNPDMDYSLEYLTFRVISGGTIAWNSVGAGYAKTIQYSINGGAWTPITSTSEPATFNVSDGDVVRFKGTNTTYAGTNTDYSGFGGGTAIFDVEGNIMSLIYGDNFVGNTAMTGSYNFCSLFKQTSAISAENLILPATTLTPHCYRALFANSPSFTVAPELPAMTLAEGCYRYMFQDASITTGPDLLAPVLVTDCYDGMFHTCNNLNYIRCLATDISAASATTAWVTQVASRGTFVKDANTEWERGVNGIPTNWTVVEEGFKNPTIECDGLEVTITGGSGATIYYKLNQTGEYVQYTTPIAITADTFVEAYATYSGGTSDVVSMTCVYDDGITEPIIYCDGEYITISCDTGGAYIYYKLGDDVTYTQYETAVVITGDTTCYAYSEIDGRQSEVVSATCIYDQSLHAPIIECNGTEITITCHTVGADIYYALDDETGYTLYTSAITITADTVVHAYSEFEEETSEIVTETCVYNPYHDYSKDYLTFDILSNGTIAWNSIGTGQAKTIQYSINNGAWSSITASSAATIPVSTGDSVRFRGTNATYAKDKNNYSGFEGGTASFNISGNIMSLIYGSEFEGNTGMTGTYNFCSLFKLSNCISAENLILPSTTLTNYCYRALFSKCASLIAAPVLPATTLSTGCYYYMFEECPITTAPDLLAENLVTQCYYAMFTGCTSLNYIKCMAITGFTQSQCKQNWVAGVAPSGTFVKDSSVSTTTWSRGNSGIPNGWLVYDGVSVDAPVISCDVYNTVTLSSDTTGATIYYKLNGDENYSEYSTPITITGKTVVEAYSELDGVESRVVSQTCEYISDIPLEASNRDLKNWTYNNGEITTPYSVNALDGHSPSYAKGTFNFETSFALRQAQPTYLWFQHADQSAAVYVDNVLAEKHWGGYTAFFVDITNNVHVGTNHIKVALKNNEGNSLAPASGDFNFNATLGNVKLYTSPYLPAMNYGYDGFHVTSDVAVSSATVTVRTSVPTGATIECSITDGVYSYSSSAESTGNEVQFVATIPNPHLWNGTIDPHLYTITLEISHEGVVYHRYQRPYGLRFFEYVINETVNGETYTGFLLNGQPYLLRGCCMHDDIAGKANALDDTDYTTTFATVQELGANFLRLAHYPHPKETYDWCDRLGIIVQTEGPCVNKMQSTMPADYYEHLNGQYDDMVNQHYNHPCIVFWGLSNETTTDDKEFAKEKINGYIARIRALDNSRLIGYVMAQGPGSDPSAYYNNPNADWFGCNIYDGWYTSQNSNNPTSSLNTRFRNVVTNKGKILCYSEYGCGGTQRCHSDDPLTTTTRGNNPRHDIEYMMWLHEGQIAAIKNFPQLAFTAQWQLFDIAVANRNEGYTVCLDGVNTSTDDSLRRLNDKGLVERDHVTKKDPFYLYKAWWNTTNKFVHICGKDYTKKTDRVIKCYTNDANNGKLSLYVNNTFVEETTVTDNIATFTARNFNAGDVVRVEGYESNDTFTF